MILWIDPAQNVTLDGSSRVSQIIDRSANAVVFSQSSSGLRPDIHASALNGLPSLRADGTTRQLTSPGSQISISDYTIFAIYTVSAGTGHWLSKGSTQALNELYFNTSSGSTRVGSSFDGLGSAQHTLQPITMPHTGFNSFQTVCITKSGMHVDFYVNGAKATPSSGSNAAYVNPLNERWDIFSRDGAQSIEIAQLLVYNSRLSVGNLEWLDDYLQNQFGISTTFVPTNTDLPGIFFVGDSLTVGIGGVAPPIRTVDDATVGLNHSSRVYDYSNEGIASTTIQQALTDINNNVIQYLNNGDIVEVWLGTNDIHNGRTAVQVDADIDSYCTAIRNTGKSVKIVLTTVINRLNFTGGMGSHDGAESGIQATVNAHIRGLVGTLADAVYDAQGETNLQTTSTAPNTYFTSDGVHPTTTGYNIISDGWITTIHGL